MSTRPVIAAAIANARTGANFTELSRRLTGLLAAFLIAAAIGGPAPAGPPVAPVTLLADGLRLSLPAKPAQVARFGLPRANTIALVAAGLGRSTGRKTIPECGQGESIVELRFRGGLTLAFLAGRFSGWSVDEGGDPALRTAKGIGLGASRAALKATYPKVALEETTLGLQFSADGVPWGFLDRAGPKGKVSTLVAGHTCMAA